MKTLISKNPGEVTDLINKLTDLKSKITQYQYDHTKNIGHNLQGEISKQGSSQEKGLDEGLNLRDSKGVLIIHNKNKVIGQARTTQD